MKIVGLVVLQFVVVIPSWVDPALCLFAELSPEGSNGCQVTLHQTCDLPFICPSLQHSHCPISLVDGKFGRAAYAPVTSQPLNNY